MAPVQAADVVSSLSIPILGFLLVAIIFWAGTILQGDTSVGWVVAEAGVFALAWGFGVFILWNALGAYRRGGAISNGQFEMVAVFLGLVSLLVLVVLGHAIRDRVR